MDPHQCDLFGCIKEPYPLTQPLHGRLPLKTTFAKSWALAAPLRGKVSASSKAPR